MKFHETIISDKKGNPIKVPIIVSPPNREQKRRNRRLYNRKNSRGLGYGYSEVEWLKHCASEKENKK